MKPIRFNTEMVRAILDNRKTVTRRVVKPQHLRVLDSPYHKEHPETPDKVLLERLCRPPYLLGDLLYVRETWCQPAAHTFWYKADSTVQNIKWRPSIHMPREAARIFLRVTDVRVERLQAETPEKIDERLCDCLMDGPICSIATDAPSCPIAMAYCFASQAVHLRNRLAAYEDTGLEPEEYKRHADAIKNLDIEHMHDLLQAEKDGRLVVLSEGSS